MGRPLVAVLLGTDHHHFGRLVRWVRDLAADPAYDWVVQHGTTPLPAGLTGSPLLGAAELADLLERAAAVVTHGGPGLIMESRSHGHLPVVVARDPGLGEHVDDHQQRFVGRLGARGSCTVVHTGDGLGRAVQQAVARPRPSSQGHDHDPGVDLSREVGELVGSLVTQGAPPARWAPWRP